MLSNKITQSNTSIQNNTGSRTPSPVSGNAASGAGVTADLEKGQLIRGEITDLRTNEVKVKLEDGRILSGRLEDSVNLSIGDKVIFRVEDVSLKNLTLKIVSGTDFTSEENTIEKALEAAGLSKNSRNSSIVRELLNQQMSIDKQTISQLIRQSVLNKDTPIQTLVLMNKYHIPVNEAGIRQFLAYQNSEHSLLNEIDELAGSVTGLFEPAPGMPYTEYLSKSSGLLNLLLDQGDNPAGTVIKGQPGELSTAIQPDGNLTMNGDQTAVNLKDSPLSAGNLIPPEAAQELADILKSDPAAVSMAAPELLGFLSGDNTDITEARHSLNLILNSPSLSPDIAAGLKELPVVQALLSPDFQEGGKGALAYLSPHGRLDLADALEAFYDSAKGGSSPATEDFSLLKSQVTAGTAASHEILEFIRSNLGRAGEEQVKSLLSSKEFKSLLKEDLLDKWTLSPKDLSNSEEVNRHFESLLRQMNELREYAESSAASGSGSLQGQLNQLHDNVNFMNALNEFFTYMQLPLKLQSQFTNGELYVYSRKKAGRSAEDGISVLLHLDMEHLGPLDVYLDLRARHLACKFYLDNEDTINLVRSHINRLEDILSTKGYALNTEILPREKTVNVVEDFMKEASQSSPVARYNFDLRA